ncbi:3-phosphoshikimate 1-carboxyvinyltransferase [Candidatus Daviesbacteria bacterium]|nr:3-phosphoshikimate 1-carboxyvinyltransferase [Candidatus Daviesbacteria bacterium]
MKQVKSLRIRKLKKILSKKISIPGSKSYTNRALILAALTKGKVEIINPLFSDDTEAMIDCIKKLGIKVEKKEGDLVVYGSFSDVKNKIFKLNCRLSGTTIRFLLAFSCIVRGIEILFGEKSLNKRPIKELVDGLIKLGAKIEYINKVGYPPIKVSSSSLNGKSTQLKGDISSQYFSAILMIAPVVGKMTINVLGRQISKPYIDMTIDTINKFGGKVKNNKYRQYIIPRKQKYKAKKYLVEGDYSSAGYFFAIAALAKSNLTLTNLNKDSLQADKKLLEILGKMDNQVVYEKNGITIKGKGVKPISTDMEDCPDQIQTVAVMSAFADGETQIRGVSSLRIKETDRVAALQNELAKMKIKTKANKDTLLIYGGSPKAASIDTYNDHRMAMSFAIASSRLDGMVINNPEVVSKTFPQYWEKLKEIGFNL